MSQQQTVSDSKLAFNKAFPYVIPPIYRRVADELVVELHLLSQQKRFKINSLFAVGLRKIFNDMTKGYQPEDHIEKLFDAICRSNGFDTRDIKFKAESISEKAKELKTIDIKELIKNESDVISNVSYRQNDDNIEQSIYYSRIQTVGILTLLENSQEGKAENKDIIGEKAKDIGEELGFSKTRIEKDISLYRGTIKRITEALEIIKEGIEAEKRKNKSREVSNAN